MQRYTYLRTLARGRQQNIRVLANFNKYTCSHICTLNVVKI
uniref:Uncharacterized protein n=1 Tax=Siphoviridae sp. ctazQ13 TaxID=2823587 RepID=A0A8S5LB47_9CAUD|nr:MAG TPA: hypothetical protein [Siphoviridae sp. ctazQ13]